MRINPLNILGFIAGFIMGILLLSMQSCSTTKYVPVEHTKDSIVYVGTHDTLIVTQYDSIDRWRAGDTTFIYKYKYIDKLIVKSDTINVGTTETIPVITEVEKPVVPKWCWWLLGIVIVFVLYKVVRVAIKIYTKGKV